MKSVSNMVTLILYLNYNLDRYFLNVFYKIIWITFLSAVFNNSYIRKKFKIVAKKIERATV